MHLYLAGNNKLITDVRLDDVQADVIYRWLKSNIYVTSMDLRYNNITDEGAKHIAKLIEVSRLFIMKEIVVCHHLCTGAKKALPFQSHFILLCVLFRKLKLSKS